MTFQKITDFFKEIFQTSFSVVKIIILSKWFVSFGQHRAGEKECVILGNGPCLNEDLEKYFNFVSSRKKFCVNFFALSDNYEFIKPEYYVLAAPEFWMKDTTDYLKNERTKLGERFVSKTTWPMKLFMPFASKKSELCTKVMSNKNIELVYFNNTPVEGLSGIIHLLFKANLGMPRPHNVLIPTIYLAMNTGFKKIIILGADHSWHEGIKVDSSNKPTVNHEHFYDKHEVRMPMYKLDGRQYFIHDIFRKLHYAFKGYFILSSYSEYMEVKILNASSKSYIDSFEKTSELNI